MEIQKRLEIAKNIDAGKVWCPKEEDGAPVRIYLENKRGYIIIDENGQANINAVKRSAFEKIIQTCKNAGVEYYR